MANVIRHSGIVQNLSVKHLTVQQAVNVLNVVMLITMMVQNAVDFINLF
jgi:hypothetical protein